MYKFTIIATLLVASAAGFANTTLPTPAAEETKNYTSVRNLPVILKNEKIAADTCRLSFESGAIKEVPCHSFSDTETVASVKPLAGTTAYNDESVAQHAK